MKPGVINQAVVTPRIMVPEFVMPYNSIYVSPVNILLVFGVFFSNHRGRVLSSIDYHSDVIFFYFGMCLGEISPNVHFEQMSTAPK